MPDEIGYEKRNYRWKIRAGQLTLFKVFRFLIDMLKCFFLAMKAMK